MDEHDSSLADSHPDRGLRSASFLGLLVTQFLGATNDNILRWLVIGIGKQYVEPGSIGVVLAAGTACFVLPYLLLAAPAGYLADRFSKRRVIVICKIAEVGIMVMAMLAVLFGNLWVLMVVVAMMGSQSAPFGPSKLGSIPEMLRSESISAANGLIGLTTVAATVIGMAVGNWLTDNTGAFGRSNWWMSAGVLIGVAAAGVIASLWIARLPAANPSRRFPWDAHVQTFRDLAILAESRAMLRVAFGIMFFWSLGGLAQMNIDQFGFEGGATQQSQITPLLIALVSGVGLGSVLAGVWSGGRVELGILPLGAGGLALSAILLFTVEGELIEPSAHWTASYVAASLFLFTLGASAGLFDVPLASYMQHRSPAQHRGAILAASNFLTFSGILAAAGIFALLRLEIGGEPLFSSRSIFLLCGLATIPVFIYIVVVIPQASIRFVVWLATHTIYRVRVHHRERLPETGGALLVANHVTWADAILLLVTSSRPVRMLIDADLITGRCTRWLARTMGVIPIRPTPKALAQAIATAQKALRRGELVCIFPEGTMSHGGQLRGFKRGMLEIVRGTDVPIVPVYLDELAGSIFSMRGGKYFWQRPQQWPYPVSIWFGKPLDGPDDVAHVRQAMQDLGAEAVENRGDRSLVLPRKFLRQCRRKRFKSKVADTLGTNLTGGDLLVRTLILRRLLLRDVLADDEQHVGLILPPSVAGVVANAALALAGRVGANLNFTASPESINASIKSAGIRHVLTSRKVMEKLDLTIDAELVYLEDFREKVTTGDKIVAAMQGHLMPIVLLERLLGLTKIGGDDVMALIFTSGSTGQPKGVMLTQRNILSNTEAIDQIIHLRPDDVVLGILPFFHSFGYSVTLWTVLGTDVKGAYHVSPLEPKQVGKLCKTHAGTVLLGTPTFLRSYLRRCEPDDFASLEVVVVGAEKMPLELAEAFEKKFGVRPVEGYGITELSPLVSVNIPASRALSGEADINEGSVGRPIPGVTAKIVDPESGEDLPIGATGMLMIKGPNVMKGYLGEPDKTAAAIRDGWYVTGDIAMLDDDGFITITGRVSRFSKIGGEMVPHILVEEELNKCVGGDQEELTLAVTSLPDEKKGERLIVLYTQLDRSRDEIRTALADAGLPNLWIPARDNFVQVDEIPVLGTGKLDLKRLKEMATERTADA